MESELCFATIFSIERYFQVDLWADCGEASAEHLRHLSLASFLPIDSSTGLTVYRRPVFARDISFSISKPDDLEVEVKALHSIFVSIHITPVESNVALNYSLNYNWVKLTLDLNCFNLFINDYYLIRSSHSSA